MVEREAGAAPCRSVDSLWEIVGIGREQEPLIDDIPVSERPDLYLAEISRKKRRRRAPRRRR